MGPVTQETALLCYNPVQTSWDIHVNQHMVFLSPEQQNVDVDSSKVDPLLLSEEEGLGKLTNDFPLQNNASPVRIVKCLKVFWIGL